MTEGNNNFPLLPKGWLWTSIDEVSFLVTKGATPTSYRFSYIPQGINFVRAENLANRRIQINTIKKFIDKEAYLFLKRSQLKQNDILFSIAGTIGRIAIVTQNDLPANTNQALAIIRFPWKLINPYYLAAYLDSSMTLSLIRKKPRGVGMKNIGLQDVRDIIFPLSPLSEQIRIVDKLEELFTKLDASIKSLQNVKTQLQLYRQAILKHAFNRKLTEDWRKTHKDTIEPESILLAHIRKERKIEDAERGIEPPKIEISVLPELPETWTLIRVKDITESMKNGIYKPKQYYADKGIACLRMYNIQNGDIDWVNIKRMTLTPVEIEDYGLKQGDILLNRVNSRELVGKAAVISSELEPCVFESKNIRLRIVRKLMSSKFLNYWLLYFGQRYFNRNAQQTVGMAAVNQTQLGSMPIPFTSLIEQNLIVERIESIFSICDTTENIVEKRIMQSELLRQSILKRAFKGKLVAQDPRDESAEMLIENIRQEKEQSSIQNN